jgi:hypothetical protein
LLSDAVAAFGMRVWWRLRLPIMCVILYMRIYPYMGLYSV